MLGAEVERSPFRRGRSGVGRRPVHLQPMRSLVAAASRARSGVAEDGPEAVVVRFSHVTQRSLKDRAHRTVPEGPNVRTPDRSVVPAKVTARALDPDESGDPSKRFPHRSARPPSA
jgi:hypothetical protein